jgi:hypothetical protein
MTAGGSHCQRAEADGCTHRLAMACKASAGDEQGEPTRPTAVASDRRRAPNVGGGVGS